MNISRLSRICRKPALAFALVLMLLASPARAAEYYVHHQIGNDEFNGLSATVEADGKGPFRTILHALKTAGPGDTVNLVPTKEPYRESVLFNTHPTWYHQGGEPGKPLIFDGNGAVVSGADPCPPEGWEQWKGRIFMRSDFPGTQGLMVDGQRLHAVQMRNALKPGDWNYFPPFKHLFYVPVDEVGEIQAILENGETVKISPGEWTGAGGTAGARRVVGIENPEALVINGQRLEPTTIKEHLQPGEFTNEDGTIYYYLPEGKEFSDLEIECVVRGNGVAIAGSTAHLIIRNLHTQKVYNDGYNIHAGANNLLFQNIIATYCFDEGFSAHTDVKCEIDGGKFLFNASGVTSVHQAETKARNIISAFNDGIGYDSKGRAVENLENVILIDNGNQLGAPNLTARNVIVINSQSGSISFSANTTMENMTVVGPNAVKGNPDGTVVLRNVFFDGVGDWHFRTDHPEKSFGSVERVFLNPELTISYGSKHPWTASPLLEWFASNGIKGVEPLEPVSLEALVEKGPEALPAGVGAPPELVAAALEILRLHREGKPEEILKRNFFEE